MHYLLILKLYKIILNTCSFMGLYFHSALCLFMFHQCVIFHGVNIHNLSIYSFVSGHLNSAVSSINVLKCFNCILQVIYSHFYPKMTMSRLWIYFSLGIDIDNVSETILSFGLLFFWKYFSYQLIFGWSLIPHICTIEKDQV